MIPKKNKTDENDFKALDRLARSITPKKLRVLTPEQRSRWNAAKRGRPKKAPGTKSVPTLITVEPRLLRQVDAYAKKAGVSRSQLFSEAIRQRLDLVK
jgi:Ribbon-helix-helix protein, copG family